MTDRMRDDRLMFIAGEHVMSDWLCDEPRSEMAVSALMTVTSLATQTMNIGYVFEHIYPAPHHTTRFLFPVELIELSLPTEHICCHGEGVKGEKRWKL